MSRDFGKPDSLLKFSRPDAFFKHIFSPFASNLQIDGKNVLVTGGNSGIGEGLVLELGKVRKMLTTDIY